MGARMGRATAALDIETGGGEVLATVARGPPRWWPPSRGRRTWRSPTEPGCTRSAPSWWRSPTAPALPFRKASFDLVVSHHPVVVL